MTWDLAQAKADLGIDAADTSKDAGIQRQMDATLAPAESYCHRKFLFAREEEYFPAPHAELLSLQRYPLATIHEASYITGFGTGALTVQIYRPDTGIITATGFPFVEPCSDIGWYRNVSVDYEGGYPPDELPADLEMALWEAFHQRWGASDGAMAALGQAVGASGIRTVAIPQVISLTMAGNNGSGGGGGVSIGGIAAGQAGILDYYKRLSC